MVDQRHVEEVEEQAALFATGALPAEEEKKFQQRLAADCPLCLAEVRACERAVAALALLVPPVAPPPGARARLLEALDAKAQSRTSAVGTGLLVRAHDTEFEQSKIPGVQTRNLYEQRTLLVRMAPKTYYPAHNHAVEEQCLVLEGSVSSDGVTAHAGDFTYMPAGSSHHPLYSENGCLMLIAYT
jgi:ChrR Cupin-like domain